jgi:hypothetical protein
MRCQARFGAVFGIELGTMLGWREKNSYAAFFCPARPLAHRARCAAAIFLRADTDMVRFTWDACTAEKPSILRVANLH